MVKVELRPLQSEDLDFVNEVRHCQETLAFLHDQRVFTIQEMRKWFREAAPRWYVIEKEGVSVGYVRTSQWDKRNGSVCVGVDIHPKYRGRGFATAAFQRLLQDLRCAGWHRVWLEVLPHNAAALRIYEKLGFRYEGRKIEAVRCGARWLDSIVMGLVLNRAPGQPVSRSGRAVYEEMHS